MHRSVTRTEVPGAGEYAGLAVSPLTPLSGRDSPGGSGQGSRPNPKPRLGGYTKLQRIITRPRTEKKIDTRSILGLRTVFSKIYKVAGKTGRDPFF